MTNCRDIAIRGLHIFSRGPLPYDKAIQYRKTGLHVPEREAAYLSVAPSREE